MSAFICSDRHIATIATRYAELTGADPQATADELLRINIDSVNYRYNEDTEPFPCSLENVAPRESYQPHDLVALCDCLDYQSCERPDYNNPLLETITETFRSQVKHKFESNVWSI